jgi:threonine synthase
MMRIMEGIWKYENLSNYVPSKYRLTQGEGNTPVRKIYLEEFNQDILLKDETQNPTGSHKDRSLAYQLSKHISEGKNDFVISSSGNSSISAVSLLKGKDINLTIFLSPKLSESKRVRLENYLGSEIKSKIENFSINFTKKPISEAFKYAKDNNQTLLRGSTDPYSIPGFKSISYEIIKDHPKVDAIFIPTSSGSTALGIFEGYVENDYLPQLHVIQTTTTHPISREYDTNFIKTNSSIASSITDRVAHRKSQIQSIIKESNGSGWVVSDELIRSAINILKVNQIEVSTDAALSLAGLLKAYQAGVIYQRPLCILTGVK